MTELGPQFPAPPGEKGKIMLDKFRRTGPASLALGCSFSYLTLLLKSLLVALPQGALSGMQKGRVLHLPPGPYPSLPVCTGVCTHITLLLPPRSTLGPLRPLLSP